MVVQHPLSFSCHNFILSLARVQKIHGLTSLLKITTFGDLISTFTSFQLVNIYSSKSLPRDGFLEKSQKISQISVRFVRKFIAGVVIEVNECNDRESLEKLRGLYLGCELSEAKQKYGNLDEPYLFQYIGMNVLSIETDSNPYRGIVERIEIPASQAILVIRLEENLQQVRIPFVNYFVHSVNFGLNQIQIAHIGDFL